MSSDSAAENQRNGATAQWKRARRARLCVAGATSALALGALGSATASAGVPTAPYQIFLTATPSRITTGRPTTFTGTVSPARRRERPRLWRLAGRHRWLLLATGPKVTAGGAFSVTHTFRAPSRNGPTSLRICFPRDPFNIRTCSTFAVTITRRARPHPAHRAHRKAIEERQRKHRQEAAQRRREAARRRREARQRREQERQQRRRESQQHSRERQQHRQESQQRRRERHREQAEKHKQKLEEARRRRKEKRQR
jgi:flagellar biosynthesis GTPase FlhF